MGYRVRDAQADNCILYKLVIWKLGGGGKQITARVMSHKTGEEKASEYVVEFVRINPVSPLHGDTLNSYLAPKQSIEDSPSTSLCCKGRQRVQEVQILRGSQELHKNWRESCGTAQSGLAGIFKPSQALNSADSYGGKLEVLMWWWWRCTSGGIKT